MALSCDLRVCGMPIVKIHTKHATVLLYSYSFRNRLGSCFNVYLVGEESTFSLPETGLAIIPGYVF